MKPSIITKSSSESLLYGPPNHDLSTFVRVNKNEHVDHSANRIKFWSPNERYRWMVALCLGCASVYSSRAIMPICSTTIQEEMHWSRKRMGTLMGSFFWGYMTTQFLGGYLSDLLGGERIITIATFGWASVTLLLSVLPHFFEDGEMLFIAFLLARIALGFFQGFHFPSVSSLMSHRVMPTERQFTYGFLNSGSHIGTLFCGSIGSLMLDLYGWRVTFAFIGCMGLVWTICTRHLLLSHRQRVVQYTFDVHNVANAIQRDPIPWKILLTHRAFWAMLIGHVAHSNSFVILLSWLPTYFHDNYPNAKSWVFNVVPWVVTVPSVLFSGYLGDKLMSRNVSVTVIRKIMSTIVLLGTAFFLFLLAYSPGYYFSLTYMALAVACCGFHSCGILLNPSDLAPKFGGTVFGITNMVGAIPGFLGVYMAGYVLEVSKSWALVFNQTGIICVAGWVCYLLFGTGQRIV
jgi:MFS transporter, ACS family, solute carrier family 17 (sodium-dependent inorganic phosphate cotransporter), member 9